MPENYPNPLFIFIYKNAQRNHKNIIHIKNPNLLQHINTPIKIN